MSKHAAVAQPIWFPNQRVWRTIIQVFAGVMLAAVTLFGAVATFAPDVLAELESILSPTVYAWLVGFVAVCAAISAALSKVMAIPGVNSWLSRHTPFGSAPKAFVVAETRADGSADISSLPAAEG